MILSYTATALSAFYCALLPGWKAKSDYRRRPQAVLIYRDRNSARVY